MTIQGPNSNLLDTVRAVLRTELQIPDDEPIETRDALDLLPNSDSVRLMRAMSALERTFDIELDDNAIRAAHTVGDVVELVRDEVATMETHP